MGTKRKKVCLLTMVMTDGKSSIYRLYTGDWSAGRNGKWSVKNLEAVEGFGSMSYKEPGGWKDGHDPFLRQIERQWSQRLGISMAHDITHCACSWCAQEARQAA